MIILTRQYAFSLPPPAAAADVREGRGGAEITTNVVQLLARTCSVRGARRNPGSAYAYHLPKLRHESAGFVSFRRLSPCSRASAINKAGLRGGLIDPRRSGDVCSCAVCSRHIHTRFSLPQATERVCVVSQSVISGTRIFYYLSVTRVRLHYYQLDMCERNMIRRINFEKERERERERERYRLMQIKLQRAPE